MERKWRCLVCRLLFFIFYFVDVFLSFSLLLFCFLFVFVLFLHVKTCFFQAQACIKTKIIITIIIGFSDSERFTT